MPGKKDRTPDPIRSEAARRGWETRRERDREWHHFADEMTDTALDLGDVTGWEVTEQGREYIQVEGTDGVSAETLAELLSELGSGELGIYERLSIAVRVDMFEGYDKEGNPVYRHDQYRQISYAEDGDVSFEQAIAELEDMESGDNKSFPNGDKSLITGITLKAY